MPRTAPKVSPSLTFDRRNVFLNFPFDESYRPLLVAQVSAIAALGLIPKSVLEVPQSKHRLERLLLVIESCGASLHDMSQVSFDADGYPRFNMPFEAGLAIGEALRRKRHVFLVMEERRHRLGRTLSDLNGYDPSIHEAKPQRLLVALRSALPGTRRPTVKEIERVYAIVTKAVPAIESEYGSVFSQAGFGALAVVARQAARAPSVGRAR